MEAVKPRTQPDWLRLTRVAIIAITLICAAAYLYGLIFYFQRLMVPNDQLVAGTGMSIRQMHLYMSMVGLPVAVYAWFSLLFMAMLGFGYMTVALLLLWYKPKDRMAIFTALILTLFGTGFPPVVDFVAVSFPRLAPVLDVWSAAAFALLFLLALVFPDGRFVPRWTAAFAVFWVAENIISYVWPDSPLAVYNYPNPVGISLVFITLGIFIYAQVYRYFNVSSLVQRQQTRWVVVGLLVAVSALPIPWVLELIWPQLTSSTPLELLSDVLTTLIYGIAYGQLPITIGVAVSRYHLWDIDVILRRTVAYTLLTIALGSIYITAVIALQFVLDRVFQAGDSPLATVLSTLAIAALFNPLRRRIQAGIDGRFYRRKQDTARALSKFHARLQCDVDLTSLNWALHQLAVDSIQPQSVSTWIRAGRNDRSSLPAGGNLHAAAEVSAVTKVPAGALAQAVDLPSKNGDRKLNILGSLRRIFTRPVDRSENQAMRIDDGSSRQAPLEFDPAPDDVLVEYLQNNPGVVVVDRVKLDSPSLETLKAAGVKLIVPLVSRGELIGMLNLGPRLSEQEYTSDDIALLNNLSVQATPAVRVAQMVREQQAEAQDRERIHQELKVARLIQQTLLPKQLPNLPGWSIETYYQPARAVGGDFYDFINLPGNRLGIFVGDVTDKGVPAALVMATTRRILRFTAEKHDSPGKVLEEANNLLVEDIPSNMFVTCLYAILDINTGCIRYANAGHNPPYACFNGTVTELRATGMPLGLMPDMTYDEKVTQIQDCERVLFYSDGVVEAHNPNRQMFSFERVKGIISGSAAGEPLIARLLDDLKGFTGSEWEQEDDVTLLTLERRTYPVNP